MPEISPVTQNLLARENCVLVIIDMQERLIPAVAESARTLENIVRLIKFARLVGLPTILTEQEKLGATVSELRVEIPEAQPIRKTEFDCFACAGFPKRLDDIGRDTLIIAGLETHICVAQTALQALPHYHVHVVSDATSSRAMHNWSTALERMRYSGATITTTEMVIYELLRRAGTDEFRAALALVK